MNNLNLIENLRSQSTWRLLGLALITHGVYFAYYIQRQSSEINAVIDSKDHIASEFVSAILLMSYASLALFIPYLFVEEGHPIVVASGLVDMILTVMLIVWGFKSRNRVNAVCGLHSESDHWFHGLWTLLFTPMYFNYKVNCILGK